MILSIVNALIAYLKMMYGIVNLALLNGLFYAWILNLILLSYWDLNQYLVFAYVLAPPLHSNRICIVFCGISVLSLVIKISNLKKIIYFTTVSCYMIVEYNEWWLWMMILEDLATLGVISHQWLSSKFILPTN